MHPHLSVALADVLASWGQAAAIILAIFLFINILVGLAFTAALMFLFRWVREKTELVKKVRPVIDALNQAIENPGVAAPNGAAQQRLVQVVQRVQALELPQKLEHVQSQAQFLSAQVDQRADRVAETMIEIRARTVMVKGVLKALFLPGLAKRGRIAQRSHIALPEAAGKETDALAARSAAAAGDVKQLVETGYERPR
jgi:hypothetical protein